MHWIASSLTSGSTNTALEEARPAGGKEQTSLFELRSWQPPSPYQGSGLYNKVTRGVIYDRVEAEGLRLRNPFDTITEGIGINRLTANFARAKVDQAIRCGWEDALAEPHRSCSWCRLLRRCPTPAVGVITNSRFLCKLHGARGVTIAVPVYHRGARQGHGRRGRGDGAGAAGRGRALRREQLGDELRRRRPRRAAARCAGGASHCAHPSPAAYLAVPTIARSLGAMRRSVS